MIGFPAAKRLKHEAEDDWGDREIHSLECSRFEQVHGYQPNTEATSNRAHRDVAAYREPRINRRVVPAEYRDYAVEPKFKDSLHDTFKEYLGEQFKDYFHILMRWRTAEGFYDSALNKSNDA